VYWLFAPAIFLVTVWCAHRIDDLYYAWKVQRFTQRLFWDA
jgi:hypothetical protein